MSIATSKLIICDRCGEIYTTDDSRKDSAKTQRIKYESDGWIYKHGNDYCLECSEK